MGKIKELPLSPEQLRILENGYTNMGVRIFCANAAFPS
jgi:hypothetical protein